MGKYKAAVIGLGNIGLMYDLEPRRPHPSTHVFAYEQSSEFDLVCGIDGAGEKRKLFHEIACGASFYPDLDSALESGILADIDVVSICTPPDTHLDILLNLVRRHTGRILFCEKPIVSNIAEARRLMDELKSRREVMVIPNISRRWNSGLRKVTDIIRAGESGRLEKIHVRYTRGIKNTGSHLFDLLRMWADSPIRHVSVLGETRTSVLPEPSYSFCFELENGVTGYAEAVDDSHYYLFEIDLYLSNGKIEMRNSGDDVIYYRTAGHHLFNGFKELAACDRESGLLQDACIKNAVENIAKVLEGKEEANCMLQDAIYPLYVAEKLEESFKNKRMEEMDYGWLRRVWGSTGKRQGDTMDEHHGK